MRLIYPIAAVAIPLLLAIAVIAYFLLPQTNQSSQSPTQRTQPVANNLQPNQPNPRPPDSPSNLPAQNPDNCTSNPSPTFTHTPTETDNILQISPPLMQLGSGVKPHSYIEVDGRSPIYAPIDITLTEGAKYVGYDGTTPHYLLHFDISCEVYLYYDHLIDPIPAVAKRFPGEMQADTRTNLVEPVAFQAGELIGYSPGVEEHRFDFGVINETQKTYLADDPEYSHSTKYSHATCPYDYFEPTLQSQFIPLFGYERFSQITILKNLCTHLQ